MKSVCFKNFHCYLKEELKADPLQRMQETIQRWAVACSLRSGL